MYHLLLSLNILRIVCMFIIVDQIPLLKKSNWLFAILILLTTGSIIFFLSISVIDEFVLMIFLLVWSFVNSKNLLIGQMLLHLSLVFLFSIGINFLTPASVSIYLFTQARPIGSLLFFSINLLGSTGLALLYTKFIQPKIASKVQNILGYILFSGVILYEMYKLYSYVDWLVTDSLTQLIQLLIIFMILVCTIGIISVSTLSRHQTLALNSKKKEIEYQAMALYVDELNKQNQEIRQFRHDYMNILASLESYIEQEDLAALKNYYQNAIQPTRAVFTKHFLKLNDLQKIEVPAIRSILTTKLLLAQEKKITVHLEINESIHLPKQIDVILLVRIIGILLDNALEELETLPHGELSVVFFQNDRNVLMVIQNTARQSIEPLHQLKQRGFSTKDDNRGLGLSILDELIAQVPSLLLETSIGEQSFNQKITMIGE